MGHLRRAALAATRRQQRLSERAWGLPIEQINLLNSTQFYYQDQLGSTRALYSATGVNVAAFTYTADGQLLSQTGTASTPLRFAGQYTDNEDGLPLSTSPLRRSGHTPVPLA